MAGSVNKVILVGNLGKDPEFRSRATSDGDGKKEWVVLSVATSETWRSKDTRERREKTEWHRVVVFTKGLIKIIRQYLSNGKGAKVYVEGSIHSRKREDLPGDQYITEIVLQGFNCTLAILDSKSSRSNEPRTSVNDEYGDDMRRDVDSGDDGNRDFSGGESFDDNGNLDDDIPF